MANPPDSDRRQACQAPGCGGFLRICNSRPRDGYRLRSYKCDDCGSRATSVEIMIPGFREDVTPATQVAEHFMQTASRAKLLAEIDRRIT